MRITTIRLEHRSIVDRCHNGCKANADGKQTQMGYRVASHRAWLVGIPTPLCPECKAKWKQWYEENGGVVEEVAA